MLIPFSLLWGGLAIFWETMVVRESWRSQAAHHNVPIFFVLWGVPFVLMGLYVMFGRFITDARMRAKTIYGISDRRVLILSGLFGTTVRGFNLRSVTDISVSEHRDGIGTLKFGDDGSPWSRGNPWPGMRSYARPILELIEHRSLLQASQFSHAHLRKPAAKGRDLTFGDAPVSRLDDHVLVLNLGSPRRSIKRDPLRPLGKRGCDGFAPRAKLTVQQVRDVLPVLQGAPLSPARPFHATASEGRAARATAASSRCASC